MSCIECPRELDRNHARGLCGSCYGRHYRAGTHLDLPRRTRCRSEVLEAWEIWRRRGYVRREVAAQLGMTLPAFERACARARAATQTCAGTTSACSPIRVS